MAFGIGEDPARSITPHLESVDYPASRADLEQAAEDSGATPDVINVIKCLPREQYPSEVDVLRDLAEAGRRFALGNFPDQDLPQRDRRNIGRDAVEEAKPPLTRHP
ncbi:MAG: DUF2795 domain-containing protein [Myxococcales bacterium]|nr:DUF2795 domain-containing protein [Myxococcales bacterium]